MSGARSGLRDQTRSESGSGLRVPRVLSIAGSDPSGGAGIQADLKSIAANGGYGMAAITALTAQNTQGVRGLHVPPAEFLREQLDAVSDDVAIDAVKIGMLGTVEVVGVVRAWLEAARPPLVVLDPVMVATSGDRLLDAEAEQALRDLVRVCDLVTPNIPELAIIAAEPAAETWPEVLEQAARVSASYGVRVLAKGGHLSGAEAPDALVDARSGNAAVVTEFAGIRIETSNTHGTGCSLSSALATRIAAGGEWAAAVGESKRWLSESIRAGAALQVGSGRGPISHFAGSWERGGVETALTAAEVREQWWAEIASVRAEIDGGDFVRTLGDGSLDRGDFVWYLAQDALYLRDYARALAEAARLAPTAAEQAFWASSAEGCIVTELQLHESWSVAGELFSASPSAITTGYLNHLLATAARGDYAVLAAALLPCFWVYHDVGSRLHPLAHPEHPYADWLTTYADDAFTDATEQAITIVTALAADATPPVRDAMLTAFVASTEHEREFFAAAHGISSH
ncbi:bifunctional hydroxymethylpyrimidine kinase/phosphomethylpyrimidine kinase [Salinibacterium sp. NG22]|uniref:bifunctional hydroxymethylpyrimidine kinase/phosphomethylpyrimidine kinase n=1 Tax=Salinibacterium sp. NG22 TaxID=2792040 RepID=UPI0018CD6BE6|nr:bifunctional hydroxymethylpyrimidine kinase/phosphomethylpyrimidine kinase [Salinibacterium sp. NG22]MBH0108568.1 bifunctional hydroxymethylpyrimidine kinase/phosphomethylpyrimidine kinase [Salinibacterium sp. NG22]